MQPRPNAVSIVCTDRFRSLDFYQNVLDAQLLSGDYPVTCPWLQIGQLTITLVENTNRPSGLDFSSQAMATLVIFTDDIESLSHRALEQNVHIVEPLDEANTTFLMADPDGIYIEVMARMDGET